MHTLNVKAGDIQKQWLEVDASGKTLGRLASEIARILTGKHKTTYTPHLDVGDYVIVVNAEKVYLSGNKLNKKMYWRHSGYPGALRLTTAKDMLKSHPERLIEHAVKGMLPRNKLRDMRMQKLKVYVGPVHRHRAQKPTPINLVTGTTDRPKKTA